MDTPSVPTSIVSKPSVEADWGNFRGERNLRHGKGSSVRVDGQSVVGMTPTQVGHLNSINNVNNNKSDLRTKPTRIPHNVEDDQVYNDLE